MAPVQGVARENKALRLEVTEAGFGLPGRAVSPGSRFYVVGLRGISRSDSAHAIIGQTKGNDVYIDVRRFVYAQNEQGCISRPEQNTEGLDRPLGDAVTFSLLQHKSGQLAFLVPDGTRRVRLLLAPGGEDGLVVPAGEDFSPAWPPPIQTIDDGTTMRVHVLPLASIAAHVPPPPSGREHIALDVAVENLKQDQGIEFQTSQQLRLISPTGAFVQQTVALTKLLACRLDDGDVIPPGHVRRLVAIFEVPSGSPVRLQYRGFEKDEAIVQIR